MIALIDTSCRPGQGSSGARGYDPHPPNIETAMLLMFASPAELEFRTDEMSPLEQKHPQPQPHAL
jgi:hypothetical protein